MTTLFFFIFCKRMKTNKLHNYFVMKISEKKKISENKIINYLIIFRLNNKQ